MTELPKKLQEMIVEIKNETSRNSGGLSALERMRYEQDMKKMANILYADLELAMEALKRISVKPLDNRDRRIEIKYHNPYRIAYEAFIALREKYKQEEKDATK